MESGEQYPKELSIRVLTNASNGKGLIDLCLLKLEFRDYMIEEWCPENNIDSKYVSIFRRVFASHAAYRATFGFEFDNSCDNAYITFMSEWAPICCMLLRIIEASKL